MILQPGVINQPPIVHKGYKYLGKLGVPMIEVTAWSRLTQQAPTPCNQQC